MSKLRVLIACEFSGTVRDGRTTEREMRLLADLLDHIIVRVEER